MRERQAVIDHGKDGDFLFLADTRAQLAVGFPGRGRWLRPNIRMHGCVGDRECDAEAGCRDPVDPHIHWRRRLGGGRSCAGDEVPGGVAEPGLQKVLKLFRGRQVMKGVADDERKKVGDVRPFQSVGSQPFCFMA
ncbi:hypothetical protein ACVOMS_30140 [Bradyrhizobium guangxiense]